MRTALKWLHISDIHFNNITAWRDDIATDSLIEYLKAVFKKDDSLRPDLVFCTGDIAFGETNSSPLSDQYKKAEIFFDKLLAACGQDSTPLPKVRLFVVPGNHDVNRKNVNPDAQETLNRKANEATKYVQEMNKRFNDRPDVFMDGIKRLDEYAQFVKSYLPHQYDEEDRHRYAHYVDIKGLKIGIAGFNSAWSCAGPEDDRSVWLAGEWQFNMAKKELRKADLRIGLIHHPTDWFNQADRDLATRRISSDFHFWLHGHAHNAWVVPAQSNITIAAGAVGAQASDEFGINLVRIDLSQSLGKVYLHHRKAGGTSWTIAPIEVHATDGQWPLEKLPVDLHKCSIAAAPTASITQSEHKPPRLFGREKLLEDARAKLNQHPFLLVYGLRGNGKSTLIKELGMHPPLATKDLVPFFSVTPHTSPDELFRQIASPLGETAEFPKAPEGSIETIAEEIKRRYPAPRSVWIWIDRAHHLLDANGFKNPHIYRLLLGLHAALGSQWHWVFELRERPPKRLIGAYSNECEVPGLDKASLSAWLRAATPVDRENDWNYTGKNLKSIYQWLGVGHGNQAHPLAIQLLIVVAVERGETPLEALKRHRSDFERKIEERLLNDLYKNVLNHSEQLMLKALALYRSSIPHDHADALEGQLNIPDSWEGIDRRCLLSANADHSLYFLHSFIAEWVRTRYLGYASHEEDDEADFLESTADDLRQHASDLHAAIASCWLEQLGNSRRITNFNISRALEAFHHLVSAGEGGRVQDIAVELLSGNISWAQQRMEKLYLNLYNRKAPVFLQREVLQYRAVLDPDDHMVQRFLGQCWQKEEGNASQNALKCFEKACSLRQDYPPYWADLGKTLLAQGRAGAADFLARLELLQQDCPQAIDEHVRAIQSTCFKLVGDHAQAATLRMARITAGSRDPTFYNDEAKARQAADDLPGALEILDLAEKNGCSDEYTESIRTTILQQTDPAQAATLRMARITAGSRNPTFYNDEAKARQAADDLPGALEILDLAEKNGCSDEYTEAIRATVLQQTDPAQAATLRMARITAGSRDPVFYTDEAKARQAADDLPGALEILDLAEKNGCSDKHTESIRDSILHKINLT